MNEVSISVVHALTGSPILEVHTSVAVDFSANSTFMLAVLFVVAKKLNVPRVWLVILHPQASSLSRVRLSVLQQIQSDDAMDWLCTEDNHCATCGDVGDPVAVSALTGSPTRRNEETGEWAGRQPLYLAGDP